jgi:hypothetical protein
MNRQPLPTLGVHSSGTYHSILTRNYSFINKYLEETYDLDEKELLGLIILNMKRINLQLSILTDHEISIEEVSNG